MTPKNLLFLKLLHLGGVQYLRLRYGFTNDGAHLADIADIADIAHSRHSKHASKTRETPYLLIFKLPRLRRNGVIVKYDETICVSENQDIAYL